MTADPLRPSKTDQNEMERLVASFDWASTPLGPIDEWPASLRTPVRMLLTSRFAMWMGWGPALTFIYNDAYGRVTLGKKHPWALGRPAADVWAEIWDEISPRANVVLEQGQATWDEKLMLFLERSGYVEETYHTFSYSPLSDDAGAIAGLLCVVVEETERVIGERRLASLRTVSAELTPAREEREVHSAVERGLRENPYDLPFTLLYLFDESGTVARRVSCTGIDESHLAAPESISVTDERSVWPTSLAERVVIENLRNAVPGGTTLPHGAWDRPPHAAAIVPIAQQGSEQPAGFLVAGLNPYRPFDSEYAGYLDLLTGQIAARLANARAYEAERRRAESLAELDRAKTAFFSNVSHEFRTPLTLMIGPLEDALADDSTVPENRGRLELIHRNSLRLLKLVNTLLDFSRIEAGRVDAVYEATDLAEYTAELASSFRSAIERAGLTLNVESSAIGERVYVDRDMWEKIVLNLLSNAYKHTFAGSIGVSVARSDAHVVMRVADTGVGIPREQLSHVFERFHRVPNARSRTQEGTGIGLALVQELVRLHGGAVTVSSEEGAGTTFTVTIPLGTAHLPASRIGAARERASTALGAAPYIEEAMRWESRERRPDEPRLDASREAAAHRILVAEDNADMRDYIVRLLIERGWAVEAVGDGEAALARMRAAPPTVLVSDVMMPRLDGFELLTALRADEKLHSTPVILLSARAGEEARVEGMEAGADDYLVKPFAARELIARVDAQLRRGEVLAALEQERRRLIELFSQAPTAIAVMHGPTHVYDLANPRYLALLGNRDIIGKPIREALPELAGQAIHDGLDVYGILDRVYATGVPFIGDSTAVSLANRPGGDLQQYYFTFVYHPIRDVAGGPVTGIFVNVIDITAQVEATHDAEAAQRAAEEANRSKSEFLAAMSHELRTPLNAIAGHAQLLEMGVHGPLNDAQREALQRITRSESHLLGLINDVLNFAKIEAGRVEYELADVELAGVAREVMAMVEPQLAEKGLSCAVNVPPHLVAHADDEKVRQVLINLLSNAIKFTPRGGRITVDSPRLNDPEMVAIRIADTGIGIASEKQATIFDPFVQVHRQLTRTVDGTGLGLAISRDLARGMRGDLTVESELGTGAAFTLSLPRKAAR